MKKCKNLISLILLLGLSITAIGQTLPFNQDVRKGKLKNGLSYFILRNGYPENRAELALVVKAGSIDEEEDQRGLAHFCEHMAFNGTKNFPKHELVNYLESIGMEFGAELNAYTSFEETVYSLTIPLDKEEYLDKGLLVLHDWSGYNLDEDEEIEKERGVILEEKRANKGAFQRMQEEFFPLMVNHSLYADRLPIGKEEVITKGAPETLRRFRTKWYRPDRQAIIIVGDIDPKVLEEKVQKLFSEIPNPPKAPTREEITIPSSKGTEVAIITDPEANFQYMQLITRLPYTNVTSKRDYRKDLARTLALQMMNFRLSEKVQKGEASFHSAQAGYGEMMGERASFSLSARPKEGAFTQTLQEIIQEVRRAVEFGFEAGEIDRTRKNFLAGIENYYQNRDKIPSSSLLNELKSFFLKNEIPMNIEQEYLLFKETINTISSEEIQQALTELYKQDDRLLVVLGPENSTPRIPEKELFTQALKEAESGTVEAYHDTDTDQPLIGKLPPAGEIVDQEEITDPKLTIWHLSNGARVILHPTDHKKDQILMQAYSYGGTSLYEGTNLTNAQNADGFTQLSGFGNFSRLNLTKKLTGKVVSLSPYISNLSEGFQGSAVSKDKETLFQLLHLAFTQPRKDSIAFTRIIQQSRQYLKNKANSPDAIYRDSITKITSNYHPRVRLLSEKMLKEMNMEKMNAIYRERFANAGDFTFLFVGDFQPDSLRSLVETYVASLPATDQREKWIDRGVRDPEGKVIRTLKLGQDDKSRFFLQFSTPASYKLKGRIHFRALGQYLTARLLENVREEKGGAYSLGASPSLSLYPVTVASTTISFPCDPERVDELKKAIFEEIQKMQKGDIKPENVEKVKEILLRDRETSEKRNGYWMGTIKAYAFNQQPWEDISKFTQITNDLTAKDLKKAARKFIDLDRYVFVTSIPQE